MLEITALSGMTAIRDFCRSINLPSSEVTIIQLIKEEEFPARKLGGVWESDKEEITSWRRSRLRGEAVTSNENKEHAENKKKAKGGKK